MLLSQVRQVVALVEQVTQGAVQGWHVRSVVRPHLPELQVVQLDISKKLGSAQERHVRADPEQVLQEESQVWQV